MSEQEKKRKKSPFGDKDDGQEQTQLPVDPNKVQDLLDKADAAVEKSKKAEEAKKAEDTRKAEEAKKQQKPKRRTCCFDD